MENSEDHLDALRNLKRFIHYGSEMPLYSAHSSSVPVDYEEQNVPNIVKLLEDEKVIEEVLSLIFKAHCDGYCVTSYPLIFVLALCARRSPSVSRASVYKAARTICETSEQFLMFTNYLRSLNAKNGSKGFGKGWRETVQKWYNSKDTMQLAECVVMKKFMSWSHKDVLRLSHVNPSKFEDDGKKAVIQYLMIDFESAKNKYSEKPEAKSVLNYLKKIEDFKRLKDNTKAVCSFIAKNNFPYDLCPASMLQYPEVWAELLKNMNTVGVIRSVRRLSRRKLLHHPRILQIVENKLQKTPTSCADVNPFWVYLVCREYELKPVLARSKHASSIQQAQDNEGPEDLDQQNAGNEATVRKFKPRAAITSNLMNVVQRALESLPPTGLKYLIIIDGRPKLKKLHCQPDGFITYGEAVTLITLHRVMAELESNVKVVTLNSASELTVVEISKQYGTVASAADILFSGPEVDKTQDSPSPEINMARVLKCLADEEEKAKYDVVIFITGCCSTSLTYSDVWKVGIDFQKLVVCCPTTCCKNLPTSFDSNTFLVFGFDENTSCLIEAFCRGAF